MVDRIRAEVVDRIRAEFDALRLVGYLLVTLHREGPLAGWEIMSRVYSRLYHHVPRELTAAARRVMGLDLVRSRPAALNLACVRTSRLGAVSQPHPNLLAF